MYSLYHIKGVKWGCSKELPNRLKNQGYTLDDVCEIVEQSDIDIASDLEKEWNIRDGYSWNDSQDYRRVIKMAIKGGFTKEACINGGINVHKKHPNMAKELGSKNGKQNGIKSRWKLQKLVLQFDLNGNFIAEHPGSNYVRDVLGIHANHALRGIKKTAGGFIWKYKPITPH